MARALAVSVIGFAVALTWMPAQAVADPQPASTAFAIGKCFDPSEPAQERPTRFAYNCDDTGVMDDMTWTAWGADGAEGTGTDRSIECQPNCAQGTLLVNPIVVHAWNPLPPSAVGCPPGAQFFSDLTIAYPKSAPPWITPGTTWADGTDFVTIDGMPAVHYSDLTPSCRPR